MEIEVKARKVQERVSTTSSCIFIVDDDNLYCHSLAYYLKTHTKHELCCYATGEECLKNLDLIPEIIILDYNLSSTYSDAMNGLEVLKQVKQIKPTISVILISSQETFAVAANALKMGAYSYLIKDAQTPSSLVRIINEGSSKNRMLKTI